jgi:DNA-3-methyladenine glycosylase II
VDALSPSELQSVGLTSAKVRTIREITAGVLSGAVPLKRFLFLSDEEIVDALIPLFGIGRWTAEMFLIFQLGRLDVWPVDDLAVRRGWDAIHQNQKPTSAKDLRPLGEPFAGVRSVLAWYCWRAS